MGSDRINLTLKGGSSKPKSKPKVKNAFGSDEESETVRKRETKGPLTIPVSENKRKFKVKEKDMEVVRALEKEGLGSSVNKSERSSLVIKGGEDTFQSETQQYKADVEGLPSEPTIHSDQYDRVPIHDFGAALLRGMGWSGEDKTKQEGDTNDLPRPHRLGLGATPKFNEPTHSRSRRPDQLKVAEARKKQQEEFEKNREQQLVRDRQRTMQNGSLVRVRSGQRAEILQLVGVPGLNMVKIQLEEQSDPSIVKRGDIEGLLLRNELEATPFKYRKAKPSHNDQSKEGGKSRGPRKDEESRTRSSIDRKRDERRTDRRESKDSRPAKRQKGNSGRPQWAINNIRVRIVTEKLGRKYFKEKGVVIDVTSKGITVQLSGRKVIDRIPERYLETALPKPGGKAVVLAGPHKYAKGQLLERDSRKSTAVIQVYEDMNVLTLSLDDIAEWCGALDDDLE